MSNGLGNGKDDSRKGAKRAKFVEHFKSRIYCPRCARAARSGALES